MRIELIAKEKGVFPIETQSVVTVTTITVPPVNSITLEKENPLDFNQASTDKKKNDNKPKANSFIIEYKIIIMHYATG